MSIYLALFIVASWSWMIGAPAWLWLPLSAVFAIIWLRVNVRKKDPR